MSGRAPRAVVLDFDGVVLESNEIKTEAFGLLFPACADDAVRIHLEDQGVSRYEKFRRIYREVLGRPLDEAEVERLDRRFSGLVRERVLACAFVPGAERFLAERHARCLLFVASATPQAELREIVAARGLRRYFRGVYGSPAAKREILAGILAAEALAPGEAVFVGDAAADRESAGAAGVPFVGVVPPGRPSPFPPDEAVVPDLHELGRMLDGRLAPPRL